MTVSLPVTTTGILISGACYRQRKALYTACRQTTHLCRCPGLVSFRLARGQGEEQERQQGWCRSADGADGSGTAHGYLGRAEWKGMFLACKRITGIGHQNSIPQERKEQSLLLLACMTQANKFTMMVMPVASLLEEAVASQRRLAAII